LYASLYGTSVESESSVDTELVETADDNVKSAESAELGRSVRNGVGLRVVSGGTLVEMADKDGRCAFAPGVLNCCGVL